MDSRGTKDARYVIVGAAISVAVLIAAMGIAFRSMHSLQTHRARTYKVAFDGAPPLSEIGPRGEPGGLAIVLIEEAAKRRGITLKWIALPGVSPEVALQNGTVDIWPAIADSEERRKNLHLTKPWLTASFALVSRKEAAVVVPADVAGKDVAFTGYPVATRIAAQFLHFSILKTGESRSDVFRSVCTGKVAAGFDEASYLNMLLLERPAECAGIALSVQIVDGATSPVSIAARRDAAAAADEIRSAFDDLAADGTLTLALNRWASFSANETRSIFELRESYDRRSRLQWGLAASIMALILLAWQFLRARMATRQARQANEAKSEFLANMELSAERLSPEKSNLRITVRDTGIGISEEQQSQLFSKFMQVDSSTRRQFGGTGLGLSIAKSLVDLMHGTISVSSVVGQGSSFLVELPFKLPLSEAKPPVTVPGDALALDEKTGLRVLLAEDNRVNQLVISRSLESLGYAVDIAENGEIAVERCNQTVYAAILMDCQMPIMDGYEASAAIRKGVSSNRSVPIIAVTAHALQGDEARCLAAGMTDYIAKPISKASLVRAMSAVTKVP